MTEQRDEPTLPAIMTPRMVADYWQCSERHVRNMVKAGHLQSFSVGKLLRIRREAVELFEEANRV